MSTARSIPPRVDFLQRCICDFLKLYDAQVENVVIANLQSGFLHPPGIPLFQALPEFANLHAEIEALERLLSSEDQEDADQGHGPLVKAIVSYVRRDVASRIESQRSKVANLSFHAVLDRELKPYDNYLADFGMAGVTARRLPRLSDFFTIDETERLLEDRLTQPQQVLDAKLGVLLGPSMFSPDLTYYRERCALRDAPLVVAYFDVDHFKKLNDKHTEPVVDRKVLPPLVRAIEAHFIFHGAAYRIGGDEFAAILPNHDWDAAVSLAHGLQARVARLAYYDIEETLTLSFGLVELGSDSPLTNSEIETRAALAKHHAKDNGRDTVVGYRANARGEGAVLVPRPKGRGRPGSSSE